MAYSELIKNFDSIRDYMREFYVYGFKSREEFTKKSARSYDDERRRIESWLGDYMCFRQTADGKNIFLSIDSRISHHNPLYKAWKAKSFTDGDITLHFLLFDLLFDSDTALSLNKITDEIDRRILCFDNPKTFDSSTVRKKLKEYVEQGLICTEKRGKTVLYRRADMTEFACTDALDFFSEVAPCGVIGSFLLDKADAHEEHFAFKHHYITGALDSEILYALFEAMHGKQFVLIETVNRRKERTAAQKVVPLRIFISVQNGRQYLMAYVPRSKRIGSFRLDNILSVKAADVCENYDTYREKLDQMQEHIWGVSTEGGAERLEHVEFTVRYGDGEEHIHRRLEREKRCGQVERVNDHTSRFSADVYDAGELVPWIRTFICRIVDIHFSNQELEAQFKKDIDTMYRLYELNGGDEA
ncbi:WYL domain-containing protein [Caproiciproducens sp.]|uniref:WYL domain-containing protein n=1 Tax=Caproiciproducens sp. TaxID=1954376 RepID=UPI0028A0DE2A|nr:WYL domain-containing protein [Caproiciproducens sp.]